MTTLTKYHPSNRVIDRKIRLATKNLSYLTTLPKKVEKPNIAITCKSYLKECF